MYIVTFRGQIATLGTRVDRRPKLFRLAADLLTGRSVKT